MSKDRAYNSSAFCYVYIRKGLRCQNYCFWQIKMTGNKDNYLIFKNCTIVDGTGEEPFMGDLMIKGNKIEEVGTFSIPDNCEVVNLKGAYLTPGFIDIHSHTDLLNFIKEGLKPKIMQGVTTEVIGQCGLGVAPITRDKKKEWQENLIIGNPLDQWNWETTEQYLNRLLDNGMESNLVPYVGHGLLRFNIKGYDSGPMQREELKLLEQKIEEVLAAGVKGISLGLIYLPAVFYTQKELETVFKTVSSFNKRIAVHLRSEGNNLISALKEVISLNQNRDCILHISHLKALGHSNWSKIDKALHLIEEHNLTFDHYPYIRGSTTLLAILPPFLWQNNDIEGIIDKLKEGTVRSKIKDIFLGDSKINPEIPGDNIPNLVGWDNIKILNVDSEANQGLLGMSIAEIAEKRNCSPADAALDLIIEEKGQVKMLDRFLNETKLIKIMQHQKGMFSTDTLLGTEGLPHPRSYGSYPRVFNRYVFKKNALSLEEAVAKMTSRPADVLNLKQRGRISPGNIADICIFESNISDRATFKKPEEYPVGIKHVLINGQFKVKNGKYLKGKSGVLLSD